MKKLIVSSVTALIASAVFTVNTASCSKWDECVFFPMFTTSPAVVFEQPDESSDRVEVVTQTDKPQVKFKIIEWLKSLF